MEIFGLDAPLVGLAIIAGAFALFALAELAMPFRRQPLPRKSRWTANLGLYVIDTLAVRLLLPLAMVGAAVWAQDRGWGVLPLLGLPDWVSFVVAILLLDLALYLQHRATHVVPLLWRLHKVHHVDPGFDVTTAARFHPVEIVLSMAYKMGVVIALGASPLAVFVFEVGFAVFTLFTHANIRLPAPLERIWRLVFITPDLHRIHHSTLPRETNSNYGTFLSLWDRLLGTYVGAGRDGQRAMDIGLASFQDDRPGRLGWSLTLPFAAQPKDEE